MKKKRITMIMAIVLVFAMLCCACSGAGEKNGTESSGSVKDDTVIFSSLMGTETLDPTSGIDIDKPVAHAIYDTLVAFGPDAEIEPMLAESWEESEDGIEVTFKLREGVKFHNGSEMTADDVIYTFDIMFAKPQYDMLKNYIASYEKVDEHTVRFVKTAPYIKLLNVMAEYSYIICRAAHEADPESYEKTPVGAGPYKFEAFDTDDSVKLVAYDEYWGDMAAFKYAVVKPPLDSATAVIALETGEIDLAIWLPQSQTSLVEENKELTLVTEEDTWSAYTILLMGETLQDNNLRKAIFHGIDRENAIKLGNGGVGKPTKNMFADRIMGDYDGIVEDFVGYDEELAKEYLGKSGYKGEEIVFSFYSGTNIAESIQADLNKIGINVKLEQLDTNDFYTRIYNGELEMALGEFGTDVKGVEDFMTLFGKEDPSYGCHLSVNEEYEELLVKIKDERDTEVRKDLVRQAQENMYGMANIVPIFNCVFNYAYSPKIEYNYESSAATYIFYIGKMTKAAQ